MLSSGHSMLEHPDTNMNADTMQAMQALRHCAGSKHAMLDFFLNLVVVTIFCITAYQFAQEAGHKELCTKNHHGQSYVEIGGAGYQWGRCARCQCVEFIGSYNDAGDKSDGKHQ